MNKDLFNHLFTKVIEGKPFNASEVEAIQDSLMDSFNSGKCDSSKFNALMKMFDDANAKIQSKN